MRFQFELPDCQEVTTTLDVIAGDRGVSRSKVILEILKRYSAAYQIESKPLLPNSRDHYALIAPTQHGKTFLAQHLFVKTLNQHKRILVIDAQKEYDFPIIPLQYDRTAPATPN